MTRQSDEELGLESEQHPDTGKWRYLWTSPGGANCIGLFSHTTEEGALKQGRAFAKKQIAANESGRG